MVKYTCNICLKEFNRKSNYDYHVDNKKKPCLPYPHNSAQNIQNPRTIPHNFSGSPENQTQSSDEEIKTENNPKSYICIYCDSNFARSDILKRHTDKYCKIKKASEENKKYNEILLEQVQELKKEIEELKKKPQSINNNVVINNSNNNNSKTLNMGNKSVNIGNKSVNIVAHGQEDLSTIDLETKLDFMNTLDFPSIIPNMAKHLFINDDKPEFKNFRVTDISRNKSEYHDGKKWNTGRADQGVLHMFENINDILIEPFTDDNLEKTIKFIQKDPKKYSKQTIIWSKNYCKKLYDTKDKENISNKNDILDELKLIFYNNREQILNTVVEKESKKNKSNKTIEYESPKLKKSDFKSSSSDCSDSDSLSSDDEYIPTLVQKRFVETKKSKNV